MSIKVESQPFNGFHIMKTDLLKRNLVGPFRRNITLLVLFIHFTSHRTKMLLKSNSFFFPFRAQIEINLSYCHIFLCCDSHLTQLLIQQTLSQRDGCPKRSIQFTINSQVSKIRWKFTTYTLDSPDYFLYTSYL